MSNSDGHSPHADALLQLIGTPGHDSGPPTADSWNQVPGLNRTIEGEIIPRLMMLFDHHVSGAAAVADYDEEDRVSADLDAFVQLVLKNDTDSVCRHLEELRDEGQSLPSLYLHLLAPAARRLGELWEDDEVTFTSVTLGISRMHQVLLRFSPFFCANCAEDSDGAHSALIVPAPGEQHTFGLLMLVEFFRREGWKVWSGAPRDTDELMSLIETERFDVVGCSVATERRLDRLPEVIRSIRERSRNKDVKVIVGGRLFSEQPGLAKTVGADATASDGMDAVRLAEQLVGQVQ